MKDSGARGAISLLETEVAGLKTRIQNIEAEQERIISLMCSLRGLVNKKLAKEDLKSSDPLDPYKF